MPTADLLRAYLEAQADLGTEEVVLPYPLRRPFAVSSGSAVSEASAPSAASATSAATAAPAMYYPPGREAAFGAADAHAGRSGTSGGRSAGLSGGAPTGRGYPGEEGPASDMPRPDAGIFAALSEALASSSTASQGRTPPARGDRSESAQPPAFADLEAFWAHLESHPAAAAGDPAATVTRVVRGTGPAGGPLALVGLEPDAADAAAGLAFQGDAGALLEKMLKAIRLDPKACYRTNVVKAARPVRANRRDLARLLPWLHAELALAGTPFVLLLGQGCAQAVLKTGRPLDELRQEPFRLEGREFCATWHPADLLAREELKRQAWEDLQWLQKRLAAGA